MKIRTCASIRCTGPVSVVIFEYDFSAFVGGFHVDDALVARASEAECEVAFGKHERAVHQHVDFIQQQGDDRGACAVFHTLLAKRTREDLRNALQTLRIPSIDLLGSTAHVMAELLGDEPKETPGLTIDDGSELVFFDLAERA